MNILHEKLNSAILYLDYGKYRGLARGKRRTALHSPKGGGNMGYYEYILVISILVILIVAIKK